MEGDINQELLSKPAEAEVTVADHEVSLKKKVWSETKKLWVVAGPAIVTRFTTFGINVISQAFIGHIGAAELAAYSFVYTVLLRFSSGVLLGMASALETLCGQAYGAKQYNMLGVYLQRSWIVLFFTSIFLLPLLIFTTPILKILGQEENIADTGGDVGHWFIAVLFSLIPSFTCQMFLQAQSKNVIITYLAAFSIAIHLLLSWLLTVKYKFGIPGAMFSTVLAYWIPNIGQLAFVMCGGCRQTWKGFSSLAFKELWPVIKLSVSSGVMLCLEICYNTGLLILAAFMKNAEVSIDALSICLNINGLEMMISLGFLAAASVRVSNELGRGDSKAAKFSIMNTEVVEAVASLSPLLAVSILLNSIQPVLSGVAVGAGWQSTVAYVNIACYYLVGIPVGAVLGYLFNMGIKGVWVGMLFGTFVQTVVLVVITYRTDWDEQVILALKRVKRWGAEDGKEGKPAATDV
ncbi:hypothetical protein I3842_10G135300 [Carya illinoinensis]|uniref:Protein DETOXIFICATION n=1 Tax=Carya illinoinensis TaxID=32201 RepID=A0A922J381_CARIL|nr:hypothetical protein I3842_10G135300 [Carya illinoinensis]KAG6692857.1 hypothetical protein I3842_10G135300 [Carya illinoinensis]